MIARSHKANMVFNQTKCAKYYDIIYFRYDVSESILNVLNNPDNTSFNKNIITIDLNFQDKKNLFGLDIEYVKETAIMNWVEYDSEVKESQGIIQLDGKIVPVLDLSKRLGINHNYPHNKISHLVVLEYHKKLCAIMGDNEPKIIQIDVNKNHFKEIKNSKYINSSVIINNQLIKIIDISQILKDIENYGSLQFV